MPLTDPTAAPPPYGTRATPQSGTYGDIYNFPLAQYSKVLDSQEVKQAEEELEAEAEEELDAEEFVAGDEDDEEEDEEEEVRRRGWGWGALRRRCGGCAQAGDRCSGGRVDQGGPRDVQRRQQEDMRGRLLASGRGS